MLSWMSGRIKMITIYINDQELQVEPGITILEACRLLDVEIPTFCHDDRMKLHGSCRICVVEIEKSNRLVAACTTKVKDKMVIKNPF